MIARSLRCVSTIGVALAVLQSCSQTAKADLYQLSIRTIEWLTDNSDVIVVVSNEGGQRKVQHIFKGDPRQISEALALGPLSNTFLSPPAKGKYRLQFIRGKSELLQEVGLGRDEMTGHVPPLLRVFYGVTHYGRIIMSESELFKCVEDRIRSGPGMPLPQIRTQPHAGRSGVTARTDFPFESNDYTYVLVVPFTVERRDYYITDLRTGDAQARIRALYELSQFDDQTARDAIQEATRTGNVQPSLWQSRRAGLVTLTSSDVVEAAKKALRSALHWAP